MVLLLLWGIAHSHKLLLLVLAREGGSGWDKWLDGAAIIAGVVFPNAFWIIFPIEFWIGHSTWLPAQFNLFYFRSGVVSAHGRSNRQIGSVLVTTVVSFTTFIVDNPHKSIVVVIHFLRFFQQPYLSLIVCSINVAVILVVANDVISSNIITLLSIIPVPFTLFLIIIPPQGETDLLFLPLALGPGLIGSLNSPRLLPFY